MLKHISSKVNKTNDKLTPAERDITIKKGKRKSV